MWTTVLSFSYWPTTWIQSSWNKQSRAKDRYTLWFWFFIKARSKQDTKTSGFTFAGYHPWYMVTSILSRQPYSVRGASTYCHDHYSISSTGVWRVYWLSSTVIYYTRPARETSQIPTSGSRQTMMRVSPRLDSNRISSAQRSPDQLSSGSRLCYFS